VKLKTVRIYGFKSFADRVELDVDGDLVAVVGSNGCGKSNIVDAIVWALGELNPRSVRAAQSTDVIFAGSAKRKPLGYAEVSLVFDNEDGALPIPTSEVVVTRRLTRDGQSDYFINRHPVRLKDIHELFADSGLGRTGYAIVNQSDIDAALSATPLERRIWIDEAAGVQKYRARKVDALKRLESAVRHLERVNDVIAEIERQREPLREQAEKARRYKELLGSLREVESAVLIKEASDLAMRIRELEENMRARRAQADEMRREAKDCDATAEDLSKQAEELDAKLESLRGRVQEALSAAERAQSRKALLEQRLSSLSEIEQDADRLRREHEARLARLNEAVNQARRDVEREESAVAVLREAIAELEESASGLVARLESAEGELANAREREVHRVRLAAAREEAARRLHALQAEEDALKQAIVSTEQSLREAELLAEQALRSEATLEEEASEVAKQLQVLHDNLEKLEHQRRSLLAEQAALDAKAQTIAAAIENNETLPVGARAVLDAASGGKISGSFAPLGRAIHVSPDLSVAIESALGASVGDLITPSAAEAEAAIQWLKRERAGRATFLPLDLVKPRAERPQMPSGAGVLGIAADRVECAPEHRVVVEALLGGVILTETLEVAVRVARQAHGFRKIVSLDGEVVFPNGAITGGAHRSDRAGPVRLSAELEQVRARAEEVAAALQETQRTVAECTTKIEEMESASEAVARRLAAARESKAEAEKARALAEERMRTAQDALARLQATREDLERQLQQPLDGSGSDVAALEAERNRLLAQLSAGRADLEQAKRALTQAEERRTVAAERLATAQADLEQATSADSPTTRLESIEAERRALREELVGVEQQVSASAHAYEVAEAALRAAAKERHDLQSQAHEASRRANELRELARALEDAAYQDDIQRARHETKRAGTLVRLLEEYGVDEADAERQASLVSVPEDAEKLTRTLRREIRALGDVNVGAIEAWEALSERYEVLARERDDVLASKAELDKSVAELDQLTRGAFRETFEKVREAFAETFTRLFGGGEANLLLTDENNLLESGVDMEVVVPGKKRQRLELLSGGERALTACAFLFALLKVKPSPLVVLDELDAPLDGRNVERYIELIRDYTKTTQFLVITHNVTTIAAAPVWFGVTMQDGVTAVLPYKPKSELIASLN
jgi:chromosome segregation protein